MQGKNVLIAGFGKIGKRLAENLAQDYAVAVLSRSASAKAASLNERCRAAIKAIDADLTSPDSLSEKLGGGHYDLVVYCLTPVERTEFGYRQIYVDALSNLLDALNKICPKTRLVFVSSTSVYHQDDSSWVDEISPTQPATFSGKTLLEAEALVKDLGERGCVVRFSGIYGAGRSMLREQVRAGRAVLANHERLSNRIHEDDCVGFLAHLVRRAFAGNELEPVYLASDSVPVDLNEVLGFIADQEDAELFVSEQVPPRRAGNKRCNNARMLESGYQLLYPGYREGYASDVESTSD